MLSPTNARSSSVVVAKMWKEEDPTVKSRFQEQARLEKEEHLRMYPDYKYQPVYRRPSNTSLKTPSRKPSAQSMRSKRGSRASDTQ